MVTPWPSTIPNRGVAISQRTGASSHESRGAPSDGGTPLGWLHRDLRRLRAGRLPVTTVTGRVVDGNGE